MRPMTSRAQRRARVRRGVAAGAVALFLASFGTVATWGRQPAAKVAAAPAPAASDGASGPYDDDSYGDGEPQAVAPPAQQDTAPAPMTTRQS